MSESTPSGNAGHRSRLRRRFLDRGLGALHEHEALELLLTYAIPRRDVKGLAKELILRFGSFSKVLDASEYDLASIDGIGENAAALILLVKAAGALYLEQRLRQAPLIDSEEACADFARMKLGAGGKETMLVILMNRQCRLLDHFCIPGTVDHAAVYPREILEQCLQYKASAVMLAHNHPSGVCQPSDEDIRVTLVIRDLLKGADIKLIDHLLVTPYSWMSFKRQKLL